MVQNASIPDAYWQCQRRYWRYYLHIYRKRPCRSHARCLLSSLDSLASAADVDWFAWASAWGYVARLFSNRRRHRFWVSKEPHVFMFPPFKWKSRRNSSWFDCNFLAKQGGFSFDPVIELFAWTKNLTPGSELTVKGQGPRTLAPRRYAPLKASFGDCSMKVLTLIHMVGMELRLCALLSSEIS